MKRAISLLMALSAIAVMVAGSACSTTQLTEILSPGFVVSDLVVSPTTAEIGQTVTVTATVTNEGEAEGVFYAPLLVDGAAIGVETVTLAAGETDTVEYSTVMTFGGSYEFVLGDQTATIEVIPSTMQNILKMVPDDWNAFVYFGAKTIRSDVVTTADQDGLADLWAIADSYLEYFAEQIDLNTAAYPTGDLPFTMAQLDYMAFGIGGLETLTKKGHCPT
ncbi:CARDB domain-containing protein [Chloroflexota bacterium]